MSAEYIHSVLSPTVQVLSTTDVQRAVRSASAQQHRDFVSLLREHAHYDIFTSKEKSSRPRGRGVEKVPVRTSTFTSLVVPSFTLNFVSSVTFQPKTSIRQSIDQSATERLGTTIDDATSELSTKLSEWLHSTPEISLSKRRQVKYEVIEDGEEGTTIQEQRSHDEGWRNRSIETLTPWYASFRTSILSQRTSSPYSTFDTPISVFLCVSTSHLDPLNAYTELYDNTSPPKLFPTENGMNEWASPDILRYFVVVHDFENWGGMPEDFGMASDSDRRRAMEEGWEEAQKLLGTLKKTYGAHCSILPLNSPPPRPDYPPSLEEQQNRISSIKEIKTQMSDLDLKNLKIFLREYVVQSLVPWMERNVLLWNEQLAATRKGMAGRLFSAGKKYFGSSGRQSMQASGIPGFDPAKGFYLHQSSEAQTRRLGDFAFMIRDYKMASTSYEYLRRDASSDKAWVYWNAATRMIGLSNLLEYATAGPPSPYNADPYLEQAMNSPAGENKTDIEDLKFVLLYYEGCRVGGDWSWIGHSFTRTAGTLDEVPSALLLEQAALATLLLSPDRPYTRKFAIQMVIAAHRYEVTGQKELAKRCFSQAGQILFGNGWDKAEAYTRHSIARLAYRLGMADEAVERFLEGMKPMRGGEENGTDTSLVDFEQAWDLLGPNADERSTKFTLPTRIFPSEDVHVRILQNDSLEEDSGEEIWDLLEADFCQFEAKKLGKKSISLPKWTKDNVAVVGSSFYLELRAVNPVEVELKLTDIGIDVEADGNLGSSEVEIESPQEIILQPREQRRIFIPISVSREMTLCLKSVHFRFHGLLRTTELFDKRGKRLNATKEQRLSQIYAADNSLVVRVRSPIPILSIALEHLPETLLAGQVLRSKLQVMNVGPVTVQSLQMLCSESNFCWPASSDDEDIYATKTLTKLSNADCSNTIRTPPPFNILRDGRSLAPGEILDIPVYCRGDLVGEFMLSWLFVFHSDQNDEYLTARCSHPLKIHSSISVHPEVRVGPKGVFVIDLEIENQAIGDVVFIDQVSVISSQWQSNPSSLLTLPLGPVPWRQELFGEIPLSFVVSSLDQTPPEAFIPGKIEELLKGNVSTSTPAQVSLVTSHLTATDDAIDCNGKDLLASLFTSRTQLRRSAISYQFPTLPPSLYENIFPVMGRRSLDLVVFWSVPSQKIYGHHFISDLKIGAGYNILRGVLQAADKLAGGLYAESQQERKALIQSLKQCEYTSDDDPIVIHQLVDELPDVNIEEIHSLPVHFIVRNASYSQKMSYTLHLYSSLTERPICTWSGYQTFTGDLQPQESKTIETRIRLLSWPTVYDVGRWHIQAVMENSATFGRYGSPRLVYTHSPKSLYSQWEEATLVSAPLLVET